MNNGVVVGIVVIPMALIFGNTVLIRVRRGRGVDKRAAVIRVAFRAGVLLGYTRVDFRVRQG